MRNPYEVLGVEKSATDDEIKKAYRKLVKTCHPDHHPEKAEAFIELDAAYKILSDPEQRKVLDETGLFGESLKMHGTAKAELRTLVSILFSQQPWDEDDLCRALRERVLFSKSKFSGDKTDCEKNIIRFKAGIKRAKSKGKSNVITEALAGEIVACQNQQKAIEQNIELCAEMERQLDLLEWVTDKKEGEEVTLNTLAFFNMTPKPEFFKR